jgi:DNA-binding response OmpR family regulator
VTCCPQCGAPKADRHTRGALTTELNPPRAWWRGLPLPLNRNQVRLLHLLCQRGVATHFACQMVGVGEDAGPDTIKTVVCKMRKLIPAEIKITNIHGWGYELTLSEDE